MVLWLTNQRKARHIDFQSILIELKSISGEQAKQFNAFTRIVIAFACALLLGNDTINLNLFKLIYRCGKAANATKVALNANNVITIVNTIVIAVFAAAFPQSMQL